MSGISRLFLRQSGLTLVELMISMALSLLVVMAVSALFVSAKSGYVAQDDEVRIHDTGRYALEVVARALRQASYENWDPQDGPVGAPDSLGPAVTGIDARSLKSTTPGIDSPVAKSINGSDILAVRFFGSGNGKADGTMLNCAGFAVAAAPSAETAEQTRGWSIFYVAEDATGEPELYCKYLGNSNWASQSIARGVESFQVLYGLDMDGDGLPNRLLNATAIEALDNALALEGVNAAERAADKERKTHWKKVVAVRIALLVRGAHPVQSDAAAVEYRLFGSDYTGAPADVGARIKTGELPKSVRNRERRVFSATIRLPGRAAGSPA